MFFGRFKTMQQSSREIVPLQKHCLRGIQHEKALHGTLSHLLCMYNINRRCVHTCLPNHEKAPAAAHCRVPAAPTFRCDVCFAAANCFAGGGARAATRKQQFLKGIENLKLWSSRREAAAKPRRENSNFQKEFIEKLKLWSSRPEAAAEPQRENSNV